MRGNTSVSVRRSGDVYEDVCGSVGDKSHEMNLLSSVHPSPGRRKPDRALFPTVETLEVGAYSGRRECPHKQRARTQ